MSGPESPLTVPGIPGSEDPEPPHRPARLGLELGLAVALAVVLVLLAIGFVATAAGAHPDRGTSRLGQSVGAVVCLALVVLCTRWAIHIEHRFRARQPVAQSWISGLGSATGATIGLGSTPAPAAAPRRHITRRRRGYGPVGTSVVLALLAAFTIAAIVGAVSSHSQAVRSSYVQRNGIRTPATIDSVDNTQHCSRGGCYYTAAVLVTPILPVDGAATTTVHFPGYFNLLAGDRVAVLVDPEQPDYAEIPGTRFESTWSWILCSLAALAFAALAMLEGRHLRKLLAHRRAVRPVP